LSWGEKHIVAFFQNDLKSLQEAIQLLESLHPSCGFPPYSSLDLRISQSKAAVVDVNLFPAGFNNLSQAGRKKATDEFLKYLKVKLGEKDAYVIGLVPEGHTNNKGYLKNILSLVSILEASKVIQVCVLWPQGKLPKAWNLKVGQETIRYHSYDQLPEELDAILLNIDMKSGVPDFLENFSCPIFPVQELGWHRRRKSEHFKIAKQILNKLSLKIPQIDFSNYSADFDVLENIFLLEPSVVEKRLKLYRDSLVEKSKQKDLPIVVKDDAGTYGLGVQVLYGDEEIQKFSQSFKKEMGKSKGGKAVTHLLIQEGVGSVFSMEDQGQCYQLEPTLYLVNTQVVDIFFRSLESSGTDKGVRNLNRPSAFFIHQDQEELWKKINVKIDSEMQLLFQFFSKIHSIAAGFEECPEIE